jgi:hypothetical protein
MEDGLSVKKIENNENKTKKNSKSQMVKKIGFIFAFTKIASFFYVF